MTSSVRVAFARSTRVSFDNIQVREGSEPIPQYSSLLAAGLPDHSPACSLISHLVFLQFQDPAFYLALNSAHRLPVFKRRNIQAGCQRKWVRRLPSLSRGSAAGYYLVTRAKMRFGMRGVQRSRSV